MHPAAPQIANPTTVDSLPSELLSEAFQHIVDVIEVSIAAGASPLDTQLADFLRSISLVSRRWYRVAVQTPRLWRNVQFREEWEALGRGNIPFQSAIQRSGAVPLRLTVSGPREVTSILEHPLVLDAAHRVQSIDVNGDRQLWSKPYQQAVPWPKLQRLALSDVVLRSDQLLALLHCSPALQDLHLGFVKLHGSLSRDVLAFPALRNLELVSMDVEPMQAILGSIFCPNLQYLFIGRTETDSINFESVFSRSASGAFDSVQQFVYGGSCLTTEEILDALTRVPRARRFGLFETRRLMRDADWVRVLTERAKAGTHIVPRLDTLCLYNVCPSYHALQEYCEARSRYPKAQRLLALELDSVRLLNLYWSQRRKLQLCGVDIRCWWPPNHYWDSNPFQSPDDELFWM